MSDESIRSKVGVISCSRNFLVFHCQLLVFKLAADVKEKHCTTASIINTCSEEADRPTASVAISFRYIIWSHRDSTTVVDL